MTTLVLDKDAYGARGQLSLMADFFELCCWVRNRPITHPTVADYLFDRLMRIPRFEMVLLADAPGDDTSDRGRDDDDEVEAFDHATVTDRRRQRANEDATRILGLLLERSRYLGSRYPFDFGESTLVRREQSIGAYDIALSIALRHGCKKDRSAALDFEGFVNRCLAQRHWNAFALGERIRSTNGSGVHRFRPVFHQLAAQLRARPPADAAVPKRVHDRGADVVARWDPADDRPGSLTMLVQVTVGKAETWAGKANEPPRGAWKRLLGDPMEPFVALAVPHHVEQDQLLELVENGHSTTVIDRLRLVAHEPVVAAADRDSVRELCANGVEW